MKPFKSNYLNLIFKKIRSFNKSNLCGYTIYDLPCEILVYIFNFFDLIDLVELRLVCQTWSTIIKNECKFTELNIIDSPSENCGNYFILNKPYNYQHTLIYFSSPSIKLKPNLFKSLFTELKYLNLNFAIHDNFDFEFFKLFKYLIHLEIKFLSLKKEKILSSSTLKRLAIYDLNVRNDDLLIIDAIQLRYLKCGVGGQYISNIKFNHPNSIEYLNCSSGHKSLEKYDFLKKFNSLTVFNCDLNYHIKLSKLPTTLEQLNFIGDLFKFNRISRLKFYNLLDEKIELKRFDLIITFQGIELLNKEKVNQIYSKDGLIIKLHSNLSIKGQLINSCALDENNFDNLITKLSNELMNNQFKSKLINLQTIRIFNLDSRNQNNLLNLLAKLNRLRHLNLINVSLNQNFYKELSIICSQLNKLIIVQKSNSFNINLEHLISKLNYLFILDINLNLDLKFILNCLKSNKYLWYIKTDNLIIVKIRCNIFSLTFNGSFHHSLSIQQLKKKLLCKKC